MTSAHADRLPSISNRPTFVTATGVGPPGTGAAGGGDTDTSDAAVTSAATGAGTASLPDEGGGGGRTVLSSSAGGLMGAGSGGGGGLGDRRILLGVGTYLIDTPRDSALTLRQRFLSFQEQHRGVVKSQNEVLPEIPFRLHPMPDSPPSSPSAMDNKTIMVDMATSPLFPYDEDWTLGLSRTGSPNPSSVHGTTFLTDREMTLSIKDFAEGVASLTIKDADTADAIATSTRTKDAPAEEVMSQNVRPVKDIPEVRMVKRVVKDKPRPTIVEPIARSVSFSERPRRRSPFKQYREFPRFTVLPSTARPSLGKVRETPKILVTPDRRVSPPPPCDAVPVPSMQESPRKRTSSSVSDLTEIGSIFSWHDKEFERRTALSLDMDSDNIGPTSFFQMKKSKSLLDLLMTSRKDNSDDKASDLNAFCQKQKMSHLALKKGNSFRRNSSLDFEEVDMGWRDIVNTQVIDDTDYEKFASRRKPVTPSTKKRTKINSPRGSRELKYSQADNGKLYPMFVNVGAQVKKFGRALHHNRKLLKSK